MSVTLKNWQLAVVSAIDEHRSLREQDNFIGLADYSINKELSITVSLPRGSGHTWLANYLGNRFSSLIVYKDIKHYLELTNGHPLSNKSDLISLFEIYFTLSNAMSNTPSKDFEDLRSVFLNKEVVIIDRAESLPSNVKDFILSVSTCAVVFLGK